MVDALIPVKLKVCDDTVFDLGLIDSLRDGKVLAGEEAIDLVTDAYVHGNAGELKAYGREITTVRALITTNDLSFLKKMNVEFISE